MPRCSDRAGCDWLLSMEEHRIGDAPDVPDLRENAPACAVNSCCDRLPCLHLLLRPEPRNLCIADTLRRDGRTLRDDQTCGRPLPVVLRHNRRRNIVGGAAKPGKRCHDNAIGKLQIAELQGIE